MSAKRDSSNYRASILRFLMLFWLFAASFGIKPVAQAQSQKIYWLNTQTGDAVEWFMNGIRWTNNYDYLGHSIPLAWQIVGNGDFNNDGVIDFIWENTQTGDVTYWLMKGNVPQSTGYIAHNISLAWKIVGVGDFNGDN